MRNLSIKVKLFLPISLLILGVVVFQILYFPSVERSQALSALATKGTTVCRLVGYGVRASLDLGGLLGEGGLLGGDLDKPLPTPEEAKAQERAQIAPKVRERLEAATQDEDLLFIAVYDENGEMLAESGLSNAKTMPNGLYRDEVRVATDDAQQVLEVYFPVQSAGGNKATLVAGFKMASINDQHDATQRVGLIIGMVILFIGLSVAYALGATSSSRLGVIARAAEQVAGGDLTVNLPRDGREDEIGRMTDSFARMLSNQRELVAQIAQTAQRIGSTSDQILTSCENQEKGALHQSSSVEDTRRTTDTLLSSSREIAEAAGGVLDYAEQTLNNNRQISERISQLAAHTQRITELLDGIKDIANKTDLLALNAALEGTKAGEAGRGFSLVANQMQRLADSVMRSALDIKGLTADMRDSTNASVSSAEDATQIASNTTQSARRIHLIAQQQQRGTEQVSVAMNGVRTVAQRTVDGTRQTIAATRQLIELSSRLQSLVDRFRVTDQDAPNTPMSTKNPTALPARLRERVASTLFPAVAPPTQRTTTGLGLAALPSSSDDPNPQQLPPEYTSDSPPKHPDASTPSEPLPPT